MKLFLKAKHWHLFLFIFAIPSLLQIIFTACVNFRIDSFVAFKLNPVIGLISSVLFWCWIWAVSSSLQDKVPGNIELDRDLFKLFFIISVVFNFLYVLFSIVFLRTISRSFHPGFGFILYLLPLYLFQIFCNFYCIYFIAKTFKTVELQKSVTFSDFAGEFFLFLFYFVGVWIVQPKINIMIGGDENSILELN